MLMIMMLMTGDVICAEGVEASWCEDQVLQYWGLMSVFSLLHLYLSICLSFCLSEVEELVPEWGWRRDKEAKSAVGKDSFPQLCYL